VIRGEPTKVAAGRSLWVPPEEWKKSDGLCFRCGKGSDTIGKQKRKNQVFSASLKDINKALRVKQYTDPASLLPDWVAKDYLKAVDRKEAEKLPPHRPAVISKSERIRKHPLLHGVPFITCLMTSYWSYGKR